MILLTLGLIKSPSNEESTQRAKNLPETHSVQITNTRLPLLQNIVCISSQHEVDQLNLVSVADLNPLFDHPETSFYFYIN